jgi:hypothetical protein
MYLLALLGRSLITAARPVSASPLLFATFEEHILSGVPLARQND